LIFRYGELLQFYVHKFATSEGAGLLDIFQSLHAIATIGLFSFRMTSLGFVSQDSLWLVNTRKHQQITEEIPLLTPKYVAVFCYLGCMK
jgi:hypothetical protein